jgi:hypothetical protein
MEMEQQNKMYVEERPDNNKNGNAGNDVQNPVNAQNIFKHEVAALKNDIGFIINRNKKNSPESKQHVPMVVGDKEVIPKSVYEGTIKNFYKEE